MSLTRAHASLVLAGVLFAGCACDPPPSRDAGVDAPIDCPPLDAWLAMATPLSVSPSDLWASAANRSGSARGGTFNPGTARVDEAGVLRFGAGRILVGVGRDGVEVERVLATTQSEWIRNNGSWVWSGRDYVRTAFPEVGPDEQWLRWTRYSLGPTEDENVLTPVIPEIDLAARFEVQNPGPRHDVSFSSLALYRDQHVWMFRNVREDIDSHGFVHLIRSDGSEPFGPSGRRLPLPLFHGWFFEDTLEVAPDDGGLWYLANWAPLPDDFRDPIPPPEAPDGPRRGPRAVRVFPDGRVIVSNLLVDTGTVLGSPSGILTAGVWSAMTDDGAYLVHFGVQRAEVRSWASVFARIEPDGTVAWTRMLPEPYTAVFGYDPLWDAAINLDGEGGLVFGFTNGFNPYEIRIGRLDPEGNWTLGEEGILVVELDATDPSARLGNLDVDVDGEGGYFVLWSDLRGLTSTPVVAMRVDRAGDWLWDEPISSVGQRVGESNPGTQILVRHDHHGGAWVMSNSFQGGSLQHFDGNGRPLFYRVDGVGSICWRGRLPVVAWPDPDLPPIPYFDGAPYSPRLESPSDAGVPMDALSPMDVGPPMDAGLTVDAGVADDSPEDASDDG